jgi:hypothetical protein
MKSLIYTKNDFKNLTIDLPTSKSISNRALILNALLNNKIILNELSLADDTQLMLHVLSNNSNEVNLENAGTCMRFLTAFFATKDNKNINLIGSERMKQRPIKSLVDALIKLGADINYIENPNYPPLEIKGKKLTGNSMDIDASESSQYITALMLIAPFVQNGLTLNLSGNIASFDYIKMTAKLMNQIGLSVILVNNTITIKEYNQTYGSYVPNTPTKLGLYPATIPSVVLDSNYNQPTYFIIGHDGSYNKLYGNYINNKLIDFRDQVEDLSKLRTTNKTQTPLNRCWLTDYIHHRKAGTKYTFDFEKFKKEVGL